MSDEPNTQNEPGTQEVKSAAAWKKAGAHAVVLNSGAVVKVRIPNLPQLVETGELPNDLIDVAIDLASGKEEVTTEHIKDQARFYRALISRTVVEPKITEDDVPDLPFEDVELLAELATRRRDIDAVGNHLGGLDASPKFRKFRGLDIGLPPLEDE